MSTNYPPGVTGGEPAITGYPSGDYDAECFELGTFKLVTHELYDLLNWDYQRNTNPDRWYESLRQIIDSAPDTEADCGFAGKVEAEWRGDRKGNGEYYWTCPRCGHEHVDSREAGDDDPDL